MESHITLHETFIEDPTIVGVYGVAGDIGSGGQPVVVIGGVQVKAKSELPQIPEAIRSLRRRFGMRQSWQ